MTFLRERLPSAEPGLRPHRIAVAVVLAAKRPSVVRTLREWSDAAAIAPGTLRAWCAVAGPHPRNVVGFARAVGALHHAARSGLNPVDLLDFAEKRSLDRFLQSTGPLLHNSRPISIPQFCLQQQLVRHERIVSDVQRLMMEETHLLPADFP